MFATIMDILAVTIWSIFFIKTAFTPWLPGRAAIVIAYLTLAFLSLLQLVESLS